MKQSCYYICLLAVILFAVGCNKYLDKKSDKKLAVVSSLEDLQAILDYYPKMNNIDPGSGDVSADDYYLSDNDWSSASNFDRRMYIWDKDNLFDVQFNDWSYAYQGIYYANTVLDNLPNIERNDRNENEWDNIKGQALFFRGKMLLQIAWVWSNSYDVNTSKKDLGVPVRLSSDFNIPSTRGTVEKTYNQIISDLKSSANLLSSTPDHTIRSSKAAAYGMLARAYLSMNMYDSALAYGDKTLNIKNDLLDYNSLDVTALSPIPQYNTEIIYLSDMLYPSLLSPGRAKIDSTLYKSYDNNDLRRLIFFNNNGNGSFSFKGSYDLTEYFTGVATDEIYLTNAECYARNDNIDSSLILLNKLLEKRYKVGTFFPLNYTKKDEILSRIMEERRKELLFRGIRWSDIKRLNNIGYNITLKRLLRGNSYILLPNDLRFALPIPDDIISITGMQQNSR